MRPLSWIDDAWVLVRAFRLRGISALMAIGLLRLFATGLVHAGVNQWTTNGPEGGSVLALAIDLTAPSTLYAGTQGNGIFKSTDAGASWTAINSGLTSTFVGALAIDPVTPTTLYVGAAGSVFKSIDSGTAWTRTSLSFVGAATTLAIDPTNPATVYVAAEAFGQWTGIFKSTDGGASWTTSISFTGSLSALVIDPITPTTLYAGGSGVLLKSTDGGASWTVITSGLPSTVIRALAINPTDPETLYAGTSDGVFKSTDRGASWAATSLASVVVSTVTIDLTTPATVYAGTSGDGVSKSIDGGLSWTAMNTGLMNLSILALAIDPTTPTTVYVGTDGNGVFKSTNGGAGWAVRNSGLISTFVRALAIDPVYPTIVYASANGKVFKSINGGINWTVMNNGLINAFVRTLAIDPLNPTTVYAGTQSDGVFKSVDGGTNWVAMNNGFPKANNNLYVSDLEIDLSNPETLYAAVNGVVFKSINGGTSWVAMDNGLTNTTGVSALAIDPVDPKILYAGTNEGVFKSTNGGASWTATTGGLTINSVPYSALTLAIDPVSPLTVYAGTNGAVFKSTDGGASWTPAGLGLFVVALAVDSTDPAIVYAGTDSGVFRSIDSGVTWISMNSGLTNTDVTALAIDPTTGSTLYAGTEGGGMFDFQISGPQQAGIMGFFESPESGQPVSGIAVIRGWTFATQAGVQISSVKLFIDGVHPSGDIPCCSERGDVQAFFSQFPAENTLNSGWGVLFNWGFLSAGTHVVQVQIRDTSEEIFLSEVRTVTVVRPGDFEFLDQFDLSGVTARVEGEELVLAGVMVRDKTTQQQKSINTHFRWFTSSQSLGMVEAETAAEVSSRRSTLSSLFASLSARLIGGLDAASAQAAQGVEAFFESPEDGQAVSGVAIIRGWAFAEEAGASVIEVRLVVDGQLGGTIPCCSERADVAAAFPESPNALNSGWGATFNYGVLTSGLHTISVQLRNSTGASLTFDHAVTVVKPGRFEFLDQFNLSGATARIEGEEIVVEGVGVRDKATQQTKMIDVRLRWFQSSQALGIVSSSD